MGFPVDHAPGRRAGCVAAEQPPAAHPEQLVSAEFPGDVRDLRVGEVEPVPVGVAADDLFHAGAGRQDRSDVVAAVRDRRAGGVG